MLLGREICFGCRKPKSNPEWYCGACTDTTKRHIAASEVLIKAAKLAKERVIRASKAERRERRLFAEFRRLAVA